MKAVSTENDSDVRELDKGKVNNNWEGGEEEASSSLFWPPPPSSSCDHLLSLDTQFSHRCGSLAGDVWDRGQERTCSFNVCTPAVLRRDF